MKKFINAFNFFLCTLLLIVSIGCERPEQEDDINNENERTTYLLDKNDTVTPGDKGK